MKKITQNLTNLKAWQSTIFAFLFLFSLTINAQEVGDEFLANPGVNTTAVDADTGYDGGGNFNATNGYAGWGTGTGGAYASATANNGDCQSADRMFRMFKTGGEDGQFIHQTITALPAGNYNFGYWNKWDGTSSNDEALPTWSAEGDSTPKFTIKVQDADGAWVTVNTHVPAEPTADMTWAQETGTWTNDETRDVRVMFYKDGGTGASPSNLNNLWYIDTTTLNYASALVTADCELTVNMVDTYGDGWGANNNLEISVNGVAIEGSPFTVDTTTNSVTLETNYGDSVSFNVVGGGSWSAEMEVTIGDTVLGAGDTYTFECIDPDAANLAASVTTDGALATFSFTVDNFTVGTAPGEGDGHIHWSIFDSSDLTNAIASDMLYSTEDITFPLPNGNHTVVFSLVDPNHVALDPAVESTVEFSTYAVTDSCELTLSMVDSYGDGWNGASVEILANGVSVGSFANTNDDGVTGEETTTVSVFVNVGEIITSVWTSGTFDSEASYSITNSSDEVVGSSVQGSEMTSFEACAASTTAVTFNVDMSQYGLADGDTVHVNGEFTEWCGDCGYNVMSDEDGDGVYTLTLDLEPGSYFWKYTVNGWNAQEGFTEAVDGCTADNNGNFDRQIVVGDEDQSVTYCWNSCDACPASLSLQGIIDIDVAGGVGKGVHLVAIADIADLSIYGLGSANNQQGTDGQEFALSGSLTAGQHLLVTNSAADATGADVFLDGYLGASEAFDLIINGAGNALQGNGNDAYELFLNETVIETYGVTGNVGDSSQGSVYSMDWAYQDSWAYKVDGVWITGGNGCTDDSVTTCESECPYPFADCSEPVSCEYSISLTDLYGDGWYSAAGAANHSLDVLVGGVVVVDDFGLDFADGFAFDAVTFSVADGESIEVVFTDAGNWSGECGYIVSDNVGNVVATVEGAGGAGDAEGPANTSLTALCGTPQNATVIALLESGSWRVEAETAGHMGVGPDFQFYAEWWNANAWDKWETGLYDDRWSFAAGTMTHDTGDDGAIFGKKPALDVAFPDNTAYDADNTDDEYLYYIQDDYTDTYTVSEEGAETTSVTMAGIGQVGFFVGGAEHIVLESTETTMYLRNLGTEGVGNSWYHRLTTAEALSTVDAMVLDMRIYPNPSNGSYVTIQTPVNGVKYVEVFDITGKRLINTSLSANTLDVSSMSAGMYLVKVTIEGQSKTSKLIIR